MSQLLSCSNCAFNPLQYDSLGTTFGYCVQHRLVLLDADALTCGRQVRKDLLWESREREHLLHARRYPNDRVAFVSPTANGADAAQLTDPGARSLESDSVASLAWEYGQLGAKIESLAQLRREPGARAELALLSLARGYFRTCTARRGKWTAGLHLLWWTKKRLADDPPVVVGDLRLLPIDGLDREIELAKWSLAMLRLAFVSDVGHQAARDGDKAGRLAGLAEEAARSVVSLRPAALLKWVKNRAVPVLDLVLPWERYEALSQKLHTGPG